MREAIEIKCKNIYNRMDHLVVKAEREGGWNLYTRRHAGIQEYNKRRNKEERNQCD